MATTYVSMLLPKDHNISLRLLAALENKSRSDIIRDALQEYLARNQDRLTDLDLLPKGIHAGEKKYEPGPQT